jgi:hypothetical protein
VRCAKPVTQPSRKPKQHMGLGAGLRQKRKKNVRHHARPAFSNNFLITFSDYGVGGTPKKFSNLQLGGIESPILYGLLR